MEKNLKRSLSILLLFGLAGCQTFSTNPNDKIVKVDGLDILVMPKGENEYWASGGLTEGRDTNMAVAKPRHIKAIEQVSGCKVTAAEYMPNRWILQSVVECSPK